MRIEINLKKKIATAIQKKADKDNRSRKSYIEYLCIKNVSEKISDSFEFNRGYSKGYNDATKEASDEISKNYIHNKDF